MVYSDEDFEWGDAIVNNPDGTLPQEVAPSDMVLVMFRCHAGCFTDWVSRVQDWEWDWNQLDEDGDILEYRLLAHHPYYQRLDIAALKDNALYGIF